MDLNKSLARHWIEQYPRVGLMLERVLAFEDMCECMAQGVSFGASEWVVESYKLLPPEARANARQEYEAYMQRRAKELHQPKKYNYTEFSDADFSELLGQMILYAGASLYQELNPHPSRCDACTQWGTNDDVPPSFRDAWRWVDDDTP